MVEQGIEPDFGQPLEAAKRELERLLREREQLELEIRKMSQLVQALRAVADPEEEGPEVKSLADAVRATLQASDAPMTAPEVRDSVLKMGFENARYSQLLATIHIILNRLIKSSEVTPFQMQDGTKVFWWTLNGTPRVWRFNVSPSPSISGYDLMKTIRVGTGMGSVGEILGLTEKGSKASKTIQDAVKKLDTLAETTLPDGGKKK